MSYVVRDLTGSQVDNAEAQALVDRERSSPLIQPGASGVAPSRAREREPERELSCSVDRRRGAKIADRAGPRAATTPSPPGARFPHPSAYSVSLSSKYWPMQIDEIDGPELDGHAL